jgi:hypothetical protein
VGVGRMVEICLEMRRRKGKITSVLAACKMGEVVVRCVAQAQCNGDGAWGRLFQLCNNKES